MGFKVKFWGVRGSIACPSEKYVVYGGNTACIEIACGGRRLVMDCGTGLRNFGHWLMRKGIGHADILLSHTHWDHINGFPFFSPAFRDDFEFTIHAGHLRSSGLTIREVMAGQMVQPMFPVPIDAMSAKLGFRDFSAGETFMIDDAVTVHTTPLNHPNNATGYRIEYGGKSVCYVTDTEHVPGRPDQKVLDLIRDADLVIYDCTYTDAEFPAKVGWGHSTWQEGVRLCRRAGAKRLAIFHHDPDHDDDFMAQLEKDARHLWTGALVARENMRIILS
jgi:phosphoribosyl 1,2-cyclic phosphodiesterase